MMIKRLITIQEPFLHPPLHMETDTSGLFTECDHYNAMCGST